MYQSKLSFFFLTVAMCLGCRQENAPKAIPPGPFEMSVSIVSKHPSVEDAEFKEEEKHVFSNLDSLQEYLRSLDWQNSGIRFEIEIVKQEPSSSVAKLEIRQLDGPPRSTEFVFLEDATRPKDKTRTEVSEGMTAEMVATMTRQFFDHQIENGDN